MAEDYQKTFQGKEYKNEWSLTEAIHNANIRCETCVNYRAVPHQYVNEDIGFCVEVWEWVLATDMDSPDDCEMYEPNDLMSEIVGEKLEAIDYAKGDNRADF